MESWALMARGAMEFATSRRDNFVSSQYSFLNELLLAGYVVEDKKGLPLLSNYRTNVLKLENKGNLEEIE